MPDGLNKTVTIAFRCRPKHAAALRRLAARREQRPSELLRELVASCVEAQP